MNRVFQKSVILMISLSTRALFADSSALLTELYKDVNGFSIDTKETSLIEGVGGNATYGEITDEAVQKLIDELKLKRTDVFYDLGSGVGRMTVKMHLDSPVKKAVGIELSPSRFQSAVNIQKKLEEQGKKAKGRILAFKNDDILKANIDDATVIYTASTCFSDDFMKKLTDKLAKLNKGLRVMTLRQLAPHDSFKLIKQYTLPMTWSRNVEVYVYELQ